MVFTTVYGGFKGIGIEGITRDDSGTFPNDGFKGKCFLEPIEKDNWKIAMWSKKTSG